MAKLIKPEWLEQGFFVLGEKGKIRQVIQEALKKELEKDFDYSYEHKELMWIHIIHWRKVGKPKYQAGFYAGILEESPILQVGFSIEKGVRKKHTEKKEEILTRNWDWERFKQEKNDGRVYQVLVKANRTCGVLYIGCGFDNDYEYFYIRKGQIFGKGMNEPLNRKQWKKLRDWLREKRDDQWGWFNVFGAYNTHEVKNLKERDFIHIFKALKPLVDLSEEGYKWKPQKKNKGMNF